MTRLAFRLSGFWLKDTDEDDAYGFAIENNSFNGCSERGTVAFGPSAILI